MTIIAIMLFVILCPCVSYIMIRRKIIPWNGSAMLWIEGDGYMPIKSYPRNQKIGDSVVKGLFFPGIRQCFLPKMKLFADCRNDKVENIFYFFSEEDEGVYITFSNTLEYKETRSIYLIIESPFYFKGGQKYRKDSATLYGNDYTLTFRALHL